MYCPKCGWNNADDAAKCANCFAEMAPSQPQPTQQVPQQQPYAQQPYAQQPYDQQQYVAQPAVAVPDHMVWAIVMTVISFLCCSLLALAFSIVAIVKCSSANNKKGIGDFQGALQDANAAKTWLYWAVGIDVLAVIIGVVWGIAAMMSGLHNMPRNF